MRSQAQAVGALPPVLMGLLNKWVGFKDFNFAVDSSGGLVSDVATWGLRVPSQNYVGED